jgi:hypothetical protein
MSREAKHARAIEWTIRNLGRLAIKEGDHARARAYLEESLSLSQHLGNEVPTITALGYLGLNAIESGDFAAARTNLEDALTIACASDFAFGIATTLMYFAALAAAQSDQTRALHLSGASELLAESTGGAPAQLSKPLVDRWLNLCREELGPELSAAAWAEGRAMSRDRAIEDALKG